MDKNVIMHEGCTFTQFRTLQLGLHWFGESGGGADRMYAELLNALPQVGVACRGLVAGSEVVIHESLGRVRAFAPPEASIFERLLAARSAFRHEIDLGRPDLIVSHFALYTTPVLRVLDDCKLPMTVHFQGPWAGESNAEGESRLSVIIKKKLERRVYARAKRLIVLSHAFGEILIRNYRISPERICRIAPGINTARFAPLCDRQTSRRRIGWPTDRPIVLAVRRIVQRMGLENLIDAIVTVREQVADVLVMIAGKGTLLEQLRQKIKDLGLEKHVRMLGYVPDDDLPVAYSAADLSVVPTVALEGFGLIVVESLASGTPVLVTPVGGLPEAVRDLSSNLIMPGSDVSSIAASLTDALTGRLPLPSAEACRTFAVKNYDWRVIAPKIRAVYEEAIASE